MKIQDQNLQLSSQTRFYQQQSLTQGHEKYLGGQLLSAERQHDFEENKRLESHSNRNHETRSLVNESNKALAEKSMQKWEPVEQDSASERRTVFPNPFPRLAAAETEQSEAVENKRELPPHLLKMIEVIEGLMERMTGRPYRLQVYGYEPRQDSKGSDLKAPDAAASESLKVSEGASTQRSLRLDINAGEDASQLKGERIYRHAQYYEAEQMRFAAKGHVTTEDGREIEFKFQSMVSREFATQAHFEMTKGLVAQDPLVVNYGGQAARLTLDKVAFDLDQDGQKEQVAFVESGSGFLALDKNGNGQIDDGSELFGPESGNGFSDLAAYDEDQNGWIDENDAIFSQLKIWHQDANGLQRLDGLLDLHVGAIALQNVESNYTYKDNQNESLAQIRASSVFLKEDGGVGSVQQIDLVV